MESVRKRSLGPYAASIPIGNADAFTPNSQPIGRTHRRPLPSKSPRICGLRRFEVAILLMGLGISCLIYSITNIVFLPQESETNLIKTMERILHHDLPHAVTISSTGSVSSAQYLPQRPRMVGVYFENAHSENYIGTERIPVNTYRLSKIHTTIDIDSATKKRRERRGSREQRDVLADPLETDACKAQYEWQLSSKPACNLLMEHDLTHLELDQNNEEPFVRILSNGYWRDVWKMQENGEKTVLKTLRYEHDYKPRNYDRHRRDAVAMEQLTSSPWVMNIYSFCGNSGIFEYANGGSLDDSLFADDEEVKKWSPSEKVVVAYQVASGLAAVHNYPKEGVAAIAHTDITASQYVYVGSDGVYKLNDFNRCRFLPWNVATNSTCSFEIGNNPGTFRSPEEFAYKSETEKIDVYSMGNILYEILTGLFPFEAEEDSKKVQRLVKKGARPPLGSEFSNSSDPFVQALVNATYRCWEHDPQERASAREIQRYLESTLIKLGVKKS